MHHIIIHGRAYCIFQSAAEDAVVRGSPMPRRHPILQLIYEEWGRAGLAGTSPDLEAFSTANVIKMCQMTALEHPDWNPKLYMRNPNSLLKKGQYTAWWTCGVKSWEDAAEEVEEEEEEEQLMEPHGEMDKRDALKEASEEMSEMAPEVAQDEVPDEVPDEAPEDDNTGAPCIPLPLHLRLRQLSFLLM